MDNSTNKPVSEPAPETLDSTVSPTAETSPPTGATGPSPKPARGRRKFGSPRLLELKRLYLWLFLVVIILGGLIIVGVLKWAKSNPSQQTPVQSLSASQLATLANNSTTVGDAKQTLNIQSNAVFEGQVLLRGDLQVAGAIKAGGSLSLPSITVGGLSSFNQIQVNDTLSVAGNTVLQGQLSVQKSLTVAGSASFANLSASQLNVTTLQLNGDLVINRHLISTGSTPSHSNGNALGNGGTASVNGGDSGGTVTINTGSSPPAGCFMTVNFAQKFNGTPHVVISPANSSGAELAYYVNRTTTSFSVCSNNAASAATTYLFDYFVTD